MKARIAAMEVALREIQERAMDRQPPANTIYSAASAALYRPTLTPRQVIAEAREDVMEIIGNLDDHWGSAAAVEFLGQARKALELCLLAMDESGDGV